MHLAKRLLLVGGVVLAIVLGTMVGAWFYIGQPGSTPVEAWIGQQIITVLKNYITPEVTFTDLDYRRPRTVVLKNLNLTKDGQRLVSMDEMTLELAEVPREGEPLRIERIDLGNPYIAMKLRADGEMIGWSQFVRPEVKRDPESVPPGQRLSDVLVLRHVQIRNGEVRYQGADDPEPMVLPGIDLTLATAPDAAEPGWYRLVGALKRDPILSADVDGRINLDTGLLELGTFKLAAILGEEQYATLPPRLQQILRRHEARGQIAGTFKGSVPLLDPASIQGALRAELKDVRLKISDAVLALGGVQLEAGLPDAPVNIEITKGSFRNAGLTLVAAERIAGELPAIPRGFPIAISRFEADGPAGRLIHDPAGGFVGWNRLSGEGTGRPAATPSEPPANGRRQEMQATRPSESMLARGEGGQDARPPSGESGRDARPPREEAGPPGEGTRPAKSQKVRSPVNRYVRVREGEIRNGTFIYGMPGGGRPLTLRSINISLQTPPERGRKWQAVTASGRSSRLFHTALTGRFDLATLMLDLDRFTFQTNVKGETQYALLPGTIGALFRRHGMTGNLSFIFQGQVPLTHTADSVGHAQIDLRRARLNFAGVSMPAERAVLDFDVPVGEVQADVSGLALVGDGLPILEVERLQFDLAEPPKADGPLEVRTARFEHPRLRFVHAADPESGLLGWRRLINPETPWPRLSDFARFDQMLITQGEVLYDDNDGKGEPMVLSGIDMQFRTPPMQDAPGWYRLIASIHREGLFDIDLDGQIEPDAYLLKLDKFQLNGQLGERQYAAFPPKVQDALRRHEIRGKLSLAARGTFPLNHIRNMTTRIRAELTDGHMALDQTVWPIDRVVFDATVDGRGLASRYDASLFGGSVTGDVNLPLDRPRPLSVTWNAAGVRMEDTLRVVQGGDPKYAGMLSTNGSFSVRLYEGERSLSGGGTISVSNGKLIRLPVVRSIAAVVSTATLGLVPTRSDSAYASFQLHPDHVLIDQLKINSDVVDLRVSGQINYDKTVDMRATAHAAGNIGRGIGTGVGRVGEIATLGLLGRFSDEVGDVFGGVSDALAVGERVVTYRVTGPLSNPQVSVNGLATK